MKKFARTVLILAAVCFVLGAVLTAAGAAGGGARRLAWRLTRAQTYLFPDRGRRFEWDEWYDRGEW